LEASFGSDGTSHRKRRVAAIAPPNSATIKPGASPYDGEKPERRDEFTEQLGAASSDMTRSEKQRLTEHQVSGSAAAESADDLSGNISRHFAPG
jgi:hypothetical protein